MLKELIDQYIDQLEKPNDKKTAAIEKIACLFVQLVIERRRGPDFFRLGSNQASRRRNGLTFLFLACGGSWWVWWAKKQLVSFKTLDLTFNANLFRFWFLQSQKANLYDIIVDCLNRLWKRNQSVYSHDFFSSSLTDELGRNVCFPW